MPVISKIITELQETTAGGSSEPLLLSTSPIEAAAVMDGRLKDILTPLCLDEQLFCVLLHPLQELEPFLSLSPIEIWIEARMLANRLGESRRPDHHLSLLMATLQQRYRFIIDVEKRKMEQNDECVQNTCCVVLCTLLYMIVVKEDFANDRLAQRMGSMIINWINASPLYRCFCQKVCQSEQAEEDLGYFIENKDYLKKKLPESLPVHIDVDELVQTALGSYSPGIVQSMIYVLSDYNDKYQHCFQTALDRLRNGFYELNRQANGERNSTVVQPGGNYFQNSTFSDTQFVLPQTTPTTPMLTKK